MPAPSMFSSWAMTIISPRGALRRARGEVVRPRACGRPTQAAARFVPAGRPKKILDAGRQRPELLLRWSREAARRVTRRVYLTLSGTRRVTGFDTARAESAPRAVSARGGIVCTAARFGPRAGGLEGHIYCSGHVGIPSCGPRPV